MTPSDEDREPDSLADLIASAGGGAPAPDPAFLVRLRELSTDAFRAAEPAHPRRSVMSQLIRFAAVALAASVVVAAGVRFWPTRSDEPAPLAALLDRVADADSLHLRITKAGQTGEVWVAQANKLRWEETAERYLIADGRHVYRIDESANRVTPGLADYFRPDRPGLDVFAVLGLPRPTPDAIRHAQADEQAEVYHVALTGPDGTPLRVEVSADAGRLAAVRAFAVRNGVAQLVASLVVLAQGPPLPAEKFAVKPTLSEDGRVGKIADVQGVVGVRPVGYSRWTPVRPHTLLKPGDWVRADLRGANAATLRLLPRAAVVVGPGGLLEIVKPTQLKLHEGEAEITPAKGTPIELLGPGGKKVTVSERTFYRVQNEQLAKIDKQPLWLKGFKGATANESIGSLVAKVDGRNVSLSVGYHKVSVDIRDQIARTTIEESFVNHTDGQLEGVFHFPLPQDASISGFAMWIGDQMIEADVVEKQRAREIYEEIKREKRDPGLLEWTGGNIFKARVWPIFPNSEKRIRITYTQVLPLRGKQYRYSYALQSEMLQQHPLKELSLDVRINSTTPLKSVTSPTHTVRAAKTEHSARLEFAAQEYTPTRDFEAVVEVADAAPPVVVVPHRRGADGYFLVQVTPPAPDAAERELIADAGPLPLLLVCDTSASMDAAQRDRQGAMAAALLEALTPKDSFNLMTCDVNADWVFDKPRPATAENVQAARNFLAGRVSLGWTDLDRAFAAALKQCGAKSHVVYLGDGILTTGDANPQAFATRLQALYRASGTASTFHAVALGNSFEPGVLKAVGSLGGGSMRRVTGEQGPVPVALELLGEMTRPPVRNLRVEFRGWKTARVYPETLPNLVPGTQQILVGRYLPEGKDQTGEVIVTGTRDGKAVRYSATATLKDAEAGNSFLPRLWARQHLDKLLERPQTPAVKEDVIALSEEFGIITPYTSLLVLESDADRARFKVKRRFQMRNGEQFFATGRGNAEYELARQQMKRAGDWRTGLRRSVLTQLSRFGRDPGLSQLQRFLEPYNYPAEPNGRFSGGLGGGFGGGVSGDRNLLAEFAGKDFSNWQLGLRLDMPMDGLLNQNEDYRQIGEPRDFNALGFYPPGAAPTSESGTPLAAEPAPVSGPAGMPGLAGPAGGEDDFSGLNKALADKELAEAKESIWDESAFGARDALDRKARLEPAFELGIIGGFDGRTQDELDRGARGPQAAEKPYGYFYRGRRPYQSYSPNRWFDGLFPALPAPAAPAKAPEAAWPKEAVALARSLVRRDALAKLPGGLRIDRRTVTFDPRDGTALSHATRLELYSPAAWAVRTAADESRTLTEWCDQANRGVFDSAFRLGRVRAATPADRRDPPLDVPDSATTPPGTPTDLPNYLLTPLDATFHNLKASVDGSVLVLTQPDSGLELRFTIDRDKRAVTRVERRQNGELFETTKYTDFAEAGGLWWARKAEATDGRGRRTVLVTQGVAALPAENFAGEMKQLLAGRDKVLSLRSPERTVADAKKSLAGGKDGIDDRFALLNYYAGYQQWTKAAQQLEALEKLAAGKPGVRWLRTVFLQASRRNEELRQRANAEAAAIAEQPAGGDRIAQASVLYSRVQSVLAANELLALLDRLAPVYADLPKHSAARQQWQNYRVYALQNSGQSDEALALLKEAAAESPHDYSAQVRYAQALYARGDRDAAHAWVKRLLASDALWSESEERALRDQIANWMEGEGRYPDLAAYLAEWVKRDPESETPYNRYLAALIRTDNEAKAYELIARWLKAAQVPGDIPPAARARFEAAAAVATGRGHNLYHDRLDPRWSEPLADAVLFFADHPKHYNLIDTVFNGWQYQQSEAAGKVRQQLFDRLVRQVGTLPVPRLVHLLGHAAGAPKVEKSTWVKLATDLRNRWEKEADPELRHQLGQSLGSVLAGHVGADEYRAFVRLEWRTGPKGHRATYAALLYDLLLSAAWSESRESELTALLAELGDATRPDDQLLAQVAALHRLTDHMVQARYQALRKELTHPEKLTRPELAKKQAEMLKAARLGYADRLAKAELPTGVRPWAKAERLYLLARADADPKALAADCWAFLGERPTARPHDEEPTPRQRLADALEARYLAMALNLAARKGAPAELVARTLRYLDAGDAAEPVWHAAKFNLLVALDRPKELEQALAAWVKAGDADGRWRTALGYVLAEQGKLKDAIAQFEAVEKVSELGPAAYRALAGWYMAVDNRAAHEKALRDAFKMVDENTLTRLLYARLTPWMRSGQQPTELDADVLRLFAVLFEKSSNPQNYLGNVNQFYGASHDFRLLAVTADAVIGQSAGKIYPFLGGMRTVLNEVRDEATADQILAHVEELRKTAKTATDRRALDLLEMQVERRASEMLNQPGPHAARALAALRRAFARAWADGEPVLVSDLLRDLGRMSRPELRDEQLRELRDLRDRTEVGTYPRLHTAHNYAVALGHYGRYADGVAELEAALADYAKAHKGVLPTDANAAINTLVSFHESLGRYDRAEAYLQDQMKKPAHAEQARWLALRLDELYHRALSNDNAVSLGTGAKLYRALEARVVKEAQGPDANQRYQLVNLLCGVYRTAKAKNIPNVDGDLKAFAHKTLPPLLKQQVVNPDSLVGQVAHTLRDLVNATEAISFLVERIEQEPKWLRLNNQDGWSQHAWRLGQWRAEVKVLPFELAQRLLKIVVAELERDLRSQRQRNRVIYLANNSYYWPEKEPEFAQAAEKVLAERKESGPAVRYIAEYLFHGCNRQDRAIDVMFAAHAKKLLDVSGQVQLVDYLHRRQRHAESIPLLVPLVAQWPDALQYRVLLCTAYFHSGRQPELKAAFAAAEAHFRHKDRWGEPAMAGLAAVAVDCRLNDRAAAILNELIPLHQRTHPRRGVGTGTLSRYYQLLARAQSALGKPMEAIDAAGGAIVSWGPNAQGRADALVTLREVITAAPNLDDVVRQLDTQTAESGLINPVVRKAVGQAYFNNAHYPPAIIQLQLALNAQPNDAETLRLLTDCYDHLKNAEGAAAQVLRATQLSRRDIKLYDDLGQRYTALGRGGDAERAYTSIVEVLPNEAEGHQLLAEVRQRQDRWAEAIPQWEQVARIRALEPTGLIGLATAQLHERQYDKAAETIGKLKARSWPPHFGNTAGTVANLERQLRAAQK